MNGRRRWLKHKFLTLCIQVTSDEKFEDLKQHKPLMAIRLLLDDVR